MALYSVSAGSLMRYLVTLSNGVTGEFEADTEAEALLLAEQELEKLAVEYNQPVPENIQPESAEAI